MNAILTIINSLPVARPQPARNSSAHGTEKSSNGQGWGTETSKTVEDNLQNEHSEQLKTKNAAQERQVQQSDNVRAERPVKANKSKDSDFKKVLNRRLEDSKNEHETEQVDTQPEIPQTSDNKVNLAQQIKPADNSAKSQTDSDVTGNQPVENVPAQDQKSQSVLNNLVVQTGSDTPATTQNTGESQNSQPQQSQNTQSNVSQQIQIPVLDEPQDTKNARQANQPEASVSDKPQDTTNTQQSNQQTNNLIPVVNQPTEPLPNPAQVSVSQGMPPVSDSQAPAVNAMPPAANVQIDSDKGTISVSDDQTHSDKEISSVNEGQTIFGKEMLPSEVMVKPVTAKKEQPQSQSQPVSTTTSKAVNEQTITDQSEQIAVKNKVKQTDLPVITVKVNTNDVPVPPKQGNLNISDNSDSPENPDVTQTQPTNQPAISQPKAKDTDFASATTVNTNAAEVVIPTKTAQQHTDKETATNNNAKNKHAGDAQVNMSQLSTEQPAFAKNVSELTAGFGKVQVEAFSVKSDETQPQITGLSSQPATVQSATSILDQLTGDRPVIADKSASHINNGAAQDAAASVREQISLSVQNSLQQGQHQITVNLNPPELGRVSIKFTERAGELTGTLEASNSQTRSEIQQALPDILRSLEQSGIIVKRIDVSLSDLSRQPAQDFARNNNAQSQWEQLAQHSFNDAGSNRFSQDSFVGYSRVGNAAGLQQVAELDSYSGSTSNNSLNVLV